MIICPCMCALPYPTLLTYPASSLSSMSTTVREAEQLAASSSCSTDSAVPSDATTLRNPRSGQLRSQVIGHRSKSSLAATTTTLLLQPSPALT